MSRSRSCSCNSFQHPLRHRIRPPTCRHLSFVSQISARSQPPIACIAFWVDDEIGSAQVTQFVGSIPPGRAPDHFHLYEEVLFILKGEGRMWAGETNTPVVPGSCIYLPKGQVHCVENTGEGELRLLGVFYPAG
jgi:mannose-6-phosphate isomerase-like protein (cupin superfamily)